MVTTSNTHNLNEIAARMQKVSLEVIQSNNELNKRIDKLVELFETAARNVGISENNKSETESIRALSGKIEDLLEQNKNLAEGLLLLEKYVRRKSAEFPSLEGKPLPKL